MHTGYYFTQKHSQTCICDIYQVCMSDKKILVYFFIQSINHSTLIKSCLKATRNVYQKNRSISKQLALYINVSFLCIMLRYYIPKMTTSKMFFWFDVNMYISFTFHVLATPPKATCNVDGTYIMLRSDNEREPGIHNDYETYQM